jgi:hypothetical protein
MNLLAHDQLIVRPDHPVSEEPRDHRRPWREDVALRIAHALETMGVVRAPRPA